MHSNIWSASLLTLVTLSSTALAQTNLVPINFTTNWNPTGDGCVDSPGFLKCYAAEGSTANTCIAACASSNKKGSSAYNTCANVCNQSWLANNVGCWLQSCWNQVYSCAYQLAALSYIDGSGMSQENAVVPFYPPPAGASAGACSCNLGYVYGNLSAVSTSMQGSSCTVIAEGGDNSTLADCNCCGYSWPVSNILNACPSSDLSVVGFQSYLSQVDKELTASSTDKCAVLNTNGSEHCIDTYNFPWVGTTAYNPLSLPSGIPGKQALSNTAGNALTAFPSSVTVLSLLSYTSTITPVPFTSAASAATLSISGTKILGTPTSTSSHSTSSAKSTGTSTGASSSATKTSSGLRTEGNSMFLSLTVVLVALRML